MRIIGNKRLDTTPLERFVLDSDLENRFVFHSPSIDKGAQHESVRSNCMGLAVFLNDVLPEGREKSLAITHLEEVMMWSNAAIARKES